jgi:hypothetical protein
MLMATVDTLVNGLSCSDICFTRGSNDTSDANQFSHKITLQFSQHFWNLSSEYLHLEFWRGFHIWSELIVEVGFVDCFNG